MKIEDWYRDNFELHLRGRYVALEHLFPLLEMYSKIYQISIPGLSELRKDIPLMKVGNGSKIVLGWSQMHGNETTTTKALFDFLKFISQKDVFQSEIAIFLKTYTFYLLPMLNPDGSELYTRENANHVDLNRDAQELSQKESQCLRNIFDKVQPDLCLNMHDQRSIYGFENGKAATVSFLSPAADKERTLTDARKTAMEHIVAMDKVLQNYIPGQVGRYDDSFNAACVGDTFQNEGIPTILFEAGHYREDYKREKTREFIFYALLSLFGILGEGRKTVEHNAYFDIPENKKNYKDFILRNASLGKNKPSVSVAIQYSEVLKHGEIGLEPIVDAIGDLENVFAHREADAKGGRILTYPDKKLTVGAHVSRILDKSDDSIIYFQ